MTNDDDGDDDHNDYGDCFMIYTDSSSPENNLMMVMGIMMITMMV